MAQQVQQTVDEQVLRLTVGGTTVLGSLAGRDGRAHDDVAEHPGGWCLSVGRDTKLVHGETQHVGRAGKPHELLVVGRHGRLIDEKDRQFGTGMDPQPVQGKGCQTHQSLFVNLLVGFIDDVDHAFLLGVAWSPSSLVRRCVVPD